MELFITHTLPPPIQIIYISNKHTEDWKSIIS